jgi:hypothetical protein
MKKVDLKQKFLHSGLPNGKLANLHFGELTLGDEFEIRV